MADNPTLIDTQAEIVSLAKSDELKQRMKAAADEQGIFGGLDPLVLRQDANFQDKEGDGLPPENNLALRIPWQVPS